MEKLTQVSIKDKIIGPVDYDVVYNKKICHRVVHLFILNDKNILLQKRSASCKYMPNHWSSSCQGHVRYNESYVSAAKRECKEELGIDVKPKYVAKLFYQSDIPKIIGVCVASVKKERFIKSSQVITIKSVQISKLSIFLKKKKIHPEFIFLLKKLTQNKNENILCGFKTPTSNA